MILRKSIKAFARFRPAEDNAYMVIRGLKETYWLFWFIPIYRTEKMIDWYSTSFPERIKKGEY